jgi:hypothetical protein
MPGNVTMTEALGQPQNSSDADFGVCFVGYTSSSAVSAGQVSPAYGDMQSAATDLGVSDLVDVLCHAVKVTNANPGPVPCSVYTTPATTPGSYGTMTISGVTGTCVPANNTSLTPKGTYQPWMQIVVGGTVGTTGMTAYASLDGGRTKRLVSLGTATSYNFPSSDGWGAGGQAGFIFGPPASALSALYTALNNGRTALLAHFILTTGSPQVHLAADTTDNTALTAIPTASTPATAIALFNGMLNLLGVHGASLTYHTTADTALATALAAIPQAVDVEDVELHLPALRTAYEAHRVLVGGGPVHGSADSTDTWASFSTTAATLNANDVFFTSTLPPMWGDSDLYSAGPPATGAFAAIADSSQQFALIVITEPVASGDFATLSAGLDYLASFGRRMGLIVRFRDPNSGESDAQYVVAFQTFAAANHDNRIACLAGSLYVTDALRGFVYLRTFMGPYMARLQSFNSVEGQELERIAQNPGWVARGPLEGANLKDAAGNTIGHDEALRGGIDAANSAPTGGGVCCYYARNVDVAGTYVSNRGSVMYGTGSTILCLEDRRVANALERVAIGISLQSIGGADIYDGQTFALDDEIRNGLAGKIAKAIRDRYAHEFQNATDPNLVSVNPTVTVVGRAVTISGTLNVRFFGYTDTVALTFAASR